MTKALVLLALGLISGTSDAQTIFGGYEEFYESLPGRLFNSPLKQDEGKVYEVEAEEGLFTDTPVSWKGKALQLTLGGNFFGFAKIGSYPTRRYAFKAAVQFPGESFSKDFAYAPGAEVFVFNDSTMSALCVENFHSTASGEAGSRYKQIYLLMSPRSTRSKEIFLHLPSLLSSCRGVRLDGLGRVVFPANEYVFGPDRVSRSGLRLVYYRYSGNRFEKTGQVDELHFLSPANPFEFTVE